MSSKAKKNILLGFIYIIIIVLSSVTKIFQPIYTRYEYGRLDGIIYYVISSLILLILFVITKLILEKRIEVSSDKKTEDISTKRLALIYLIVLTIILIISAMIGWNVKIINDLGDNIVRFYVVVHVYRLVYQSIVLYLTVHMIKFFQTGIEELLDDTLRVKLKYIPFGGIATMLTLGVYQLVIGFNTMPFVYFLLISLYGFIYILTNKSIKKTYIACIFIYLF